MVYNGALSFGYLLIGDGPIGTSMNHDKIMAGDFNSSIHPYYTFIGIRSKDFLEILQQVGNP